MKVQLNIHQPNQLGLNLNGLNKRLQKDAGEITTQPDNGSKKDKITLSPQGKMLQMIDNLKKQKESIIERKGDLVSSTLENGGDMEAIETQLKCYDDQMEQIDKQIEQITADMAKQLTEKSEEKKSAKVDESKSKDEMETDRLNQIAYASDDVNHAKTISAIKEDILGQARVEESEIKMGELHVQALKDKGSGGKNVQAMIDNIQKTLAQKAAYVDQLENHGQELEAKQGESIQGVIKQLDAIRDTETTQSKDAVDQAPQVSATEKITDNTATTASPGQATSNEATSTATN